MNSNHKTFLVTGPLGWLGSRLVETLLKGLPDVPGLETATAGKVRCLVLPGQDPSGLRKLSSEIEIVEGDVCSPEDCALFCSGMEGAVLLHTAGVIHPRRVRQFYEINRDGTARLLDAAASAGVKRAVVVSSNSPCGCNPRPDHVFDEKSPFNPYLNYGRSKMEMEVAVRARAERLETVIIRAPWFYGVNQPPRQTMFFQMIREGKMPVVGDGNNRRSMAYLDNLCQGLLLGGTVPEAAGGLFWIADKRPYTMNEIIDTVEWLLENEFGLSCRHRRMRLPGFASEMAYLVDSSLQAVGFYHQKMHVLSEMNKTIACDIAHSESVLGYRPAVQLEEGMRRSIRWCLDHGIKI